MSPGNTPWKMLRIATKIRIVTPATKPPSDHPTMVSLKSMWKNLLIAQNPESFGRDRPIPPAQTAIAHKIGDTPLVATAVATIEEVTVSAVVVEPVAIRSTCAITKHISSIGIWNPISVLVTTSEIPQAFRIPP